MNITNNFATLSEKEKKNLFKDFQNKSELIIFNPPVVQPPQTALYFDDQPTFDEVKCYTTLNVYIGTNTVEKYSIMKCDNFIVASNIKTTSGATTINQYEVNLSHRKITKTTTTIIHNEPSVTRESVQLIGISKITLS